MSSCPIIDRTFYLDDVRKNGIILLKGLVMVEVGFPWFILILYK